MIEVRNLSYRNKQFSMEDVTFKIGDGYLMTLLGKNGAGKTTLLNLIYGCIAPYKGEVVWNDKNVTGQNAMEKIDGDFLYHEEVAYVGGNKWCIDSLNCKENIDILKVLYSRWNQERFDEILKIMEFNQEELESRYDELSTGKQMQLQLAFAMARRPKLLLLDEPMANLDPVVKTDIWELLKRTISEENISIIISTHLLEEVNDITDYIGLLENGKLVRFGDREQIEESLRKLLEGRDER